MKSRLLLGIAAALIGLLCSANAQNVSVLQTNGDQSALLQTEPSISFSAQPELPLSIHVNETLRYQKMDGFGASFTDSSAWLVGTKLTPDQQNELMRNLFTSAGAGLSFLRQPMGATDLALTEYSYDDLPAGQTDPDLLQFSIDHDKTYIIPVLQKALAFNPHMRVMALPWSPPGWMKTNGAMRSGGLNPQFYDSLANYFVNFIRAYRENGIPVHFVAAQNEPFFSGTGYPTEFLTAAQEAEFIGKHLGPALDRLGERDGEFPLIFGWEHNWDVQSYAETLLNDPVASRYIAGISFHCYAGNQDVAQGAIQDFFPNKGLWFTECTGVTTFPNFHDNLGFNMHNLLIGAVRDGSRSVVLWNMALDQNDGPTNGNGCHTCRGVVTIDWSTTPATVRYEVEYYSLGQTAKFVVPGAHRIDSNLAEPIESVAYQNPDGSIVLVAYNSSTSNSTFSVEWHGKVFTYALSDGSVATFKWDAATGPDFAVAANPPLQVIQAGKSTDFQLTLNRYHHFTRDVRFSVSGLPDGASARFENEEGDAPVLRIRTLQSTLPGTYPVTITAEHRAVSRSAVVQLQVGPQEAPFGGISWRVPGLVRAENFDIGGEGIAYHDIDFFTDPDGGTYRPGETVDLETTSDVGGGLDVGFTQPGGWMRYSVNVATSGLYTVAVRVAFKNSGGLFHVEVDAKDEDDGGFAPSRRDGYDMDLDEPEDRSAKEGSVRSTGVMHVPSTGGFQTWVTISSPVLLLSAGEHILKIVFDSKPDNAGVGNFNWIDVEPPAVSTPFLGSPSAIPGIIQAENFDNGGQNVAYYDEAPKNQGGEYRTTERIGIETTSDVGGGFDVGFTSQGEWLNYTVNVAASGMYTLHVRVASQPSGGTFHFAIDGRDVSGPIALPATGGFQVWQTLDVPNVFLPGGVHVLQLVLDGPGSSGSVGNFNWFSLD